MIQAGVGFSTSHNPRTAAMEATTRAMNQAGFARAAGAICFATTAHGGAFPLIVRTVASTANTTQVAGCSAAGVIAGTDEIESGPGVSVVVFGGDSIGAQRAFVPILRGRAVEAARELADAVRPSPGRSNLLSVFPDTYNVDPDRFVAALSTALPGVTIVGGGATEDGSIGETFQFCGDTVSSNSVSAMLVSGDFDLNIGASIACTQVGAMHRVTSVRDNIVMSLDDRPAYEIFAEAAGPLADDLRRAIQFVFIGIPLDENATRLERGRFVVRNIIGASEEHGVIAVANPLKEGDRAALVLRNAQRAREDLKATLGEMAARTSRSAPAFGLYFDCASRGSGLYGIPGHDSAYIQQHLGPIPVVGFFTGFEIGPILDRAGVLLYSGVLALVSQRIS